MSFWPYVFWQRERETNVLLCIASQKTCWYWAWYQWYIPKYSRHSFTNLAYTQKICVSERHLWDVVIFMSRCTSFYLLEFRYLEYTLDHSKIRPQDVMTVLKEVSKNPSGRLPAWSMVRQHWTQISELFGHGSFTMGAIIKAVTSTFTSTFELGEVWFFKIHCKVLNFLEWFIGFLKIY